MKLSEIVEVIKGLGVSFSVHGIVENDPEVTGVFSDSRNVTANSAFCCIKGELTDGHQFARKAIESGAVVLIVERVIDSCAVPQIIVPNTRAVMGIVAAKVYGEPANKLKMLAVTGTNGKTTTTWVIRSLLGAIGIKCGIIGTVVQNDGVNEWDAERTTPESCDIQRLLANMVSNGCGACVMETSSHGLCLGRIDGCLFDVMVFTNLNPEHLDYHKDMESYFRAKNILFDKYARAGGVIVTNVDDVYGKRVKSEHPCAVTVGFKSADIRAASLKLNIDGSRFSLDMFSSPAGEFKSPLVAEFNVRNTLAAIAAVSVLNYAAGLPVGFIDILRDAVASTPQVPGRLEKYDIPVRNGGTACCVIDFAHTPEALKNVLSALRMFCKGSLVSIFGHGGGRYPANRPALGNTAASIADKVIVTMDNPRCESSEVIANQIAAGARENNPSIDLRIITDRVKAIYTALDEAEDGDVIVVTGKGPEKYLIIGTEKITYSDADTVKNRLAFENLPVLPPFKVILDSRDMKPGCGFAAIEGDNTDGHLYIADAVAAGAAFVIGRKDKIPAVPAVPCIGLDEGNSVESWLATLAAWHIKRVNPMEIIAVTGSVGKTSTREAIKLVLSKKYKVHSAEKSFNTLVGTAVSILSMPMDTEILLLEFGANKPGEIQELTRYFWPTISVITEIAPVHLEGFKDINGVLREKMEITRSPCLSKFFYNADNELLQNAMETGVDGMFAAAYSVGGSLNADYRIVAPLFSFGGSEKTLSWKCVHSKTKTELNADVWGLHLSLPLSIAAAIGDVLNVKTRDIAAAVAEYRPLPGRGQINRFVRSGRQRVLIDDAYNANPASMSASLITFAGIDNSIGSKWAVLGDMRELGENAVQFHSELSSLIASLDKALLVGSLWREAVTPPCALLFDDWSSAYDYLIKNDNWGMLLVKGSNSHKLQTLVRKLAEAEK